MNKSMSNCRKMHKMTRSKKKVIKLNSPLSKSA